MVCPKRRDLLICAVLMLGTVLGLLILAPRVILAPGGDSHYAHEAAALIAIQQIHSAQVAYKSQFGRYAISLTQLGPPARGSADAWAAGLIKRDLATGEKSGYRFSLTGDSRGYVISASPVFFGRTGSRTFYSDESLGIRQNYGPEPASRMSKEVK
jgi:type IV pilus assembly protein PilA